MSNSENVTSAHSHSTTEELIVSYLDGELVRKELEVVLFERLATHADARQVLREHLVIRGALHNSEQDERFQLKPSVDQRTRARLQTMLKQVPVLADAPKPKLILAKDRQLSTKYPDRALVIAKPTERRMKVWSKRLVPTLLLLLLAIGTTWYVTRTTDQNLSTARFATNTNVRPSATSTHDGPTSSAETQPVATAANSTQQTQSTPAERIRIVKEYIKVPVPANSASANHNDVAQNNVEATQSSPSTQAPTKQDASDPRDVMISRRFPKMIRATNAVVVTQQDRL